MSWLGYANEEDRSNPLEDVSLYHTTQLELPKRCSNVRR